MDKSLAKVSHYGTIHIDTLAFDCVVLEDATRGYVQSQLMQVIGFRKKNPGTQFRRFLTETAPNALKILEKSEYEVVQMPHGANAKFAPAGILTEIAAGVMESAALGKLHTQRRGLVQPCAAIYRALAKTGEVALIDEASGYQRQRADNYLNDFFTLVLREQFSGWERRFPQSFQDAMLEMLGFAYIQPGRSPNIIGKITADWVYGVVFPQPIIKEMRKRRDASDTKLHQWLKDGGLSLLEKQIHTVEMIARSSFSYDDFVGRCKRAFRNRQQHNIMLGGA